MRNIFAALFRITPVNEMFLAFEFCGVSIFIAFPRVIVRWFWHVIKRRTRPEEREWQCGFIYEITWQMLLLFKDLKKEKGSVFSGWYVGQLYMHGLVTNLSVNFVLFYPEESNSDMVF